MVSPNQQARDPGPRALTPLALWERALCALLLRTEVDWVGSGATMAAYRQWYGAGGTACGRGEGVMGRLEGKVALISGGARRRGGAAAPGFLLVTDAAWGVETICLLGGYTVEGESL